MNQFKKANRIIQALAMAFLRLLKVLIYARFFCNAIYVRAWFGDLGNNLIQLANAEHLSEIIGLDVYCPRHSFLEVEKNYLIHEIPSDKFLTDTKSLSYVWYIDHLQNNINPSELFPVKEQSSLLRYYYYYFDTLPFLPRLTHYRQILKNKLLPLIPHQLDRSITDETLVIHIRSGDIFGDVSIHQAYIQPPLSFYLKIIETFDFKDIVIVTQDDFRNPCIAELKQLMPEIRIQASSLEEDVSTILSARNLVVGISTFSLSLGFASTQIKRLYVPQFDIKKGYLRVMFWPELFKLVFNSKNPNLEHQTLDFHLYPIKILNYIAIGDWHNAPRQREQMLNHAGENLLVEAIGNSKN